MEFHVSRQLRDRHQFDLSLFAYNGNAIFANFHAARLFAQKINQQRDLTNYPERAVRASQINAMGLIDEILHHVIAIYQRNQNPKAFAKALEWLEETLGRTELDRTLEHFATEFPPLAIYKGEITVSEYMRTSTEGVSNREVLLEEMLMLWIANRNPACDPYQDFFDETNLSAETAYSKLFTSLHRFFDTQPTFGPERLNLVDLLRSPAIAVPHSLTGQLEYLRERWSEMLGSYLYRLLSSLDLVKEEEKTTFFGGPGPTMLPVYENAALTSGEIEYEAFSPDREWMPRLVLLAKNTYVWLEQLAKKYKRSITRLDQIPAEELAELAGRGFTGLWLIGLWERSKASARIKQLCGNQEAIASAYSLANYEIAADLGGEEAYRGLRDRAWQYGIRLASDMVPNHMGIDSRWVVDHPDWFVQLDYSPYPSYSFNGPDLSADPAVSINLEDHYFDKTDASVVFRYYDHRDGRARFIYHGNDGTTMPWNDTAQLNYLNAEVREAVIQTILAVARRFPIIRFDAAMTLAKKHYERLWFPEPGTGGAIPSRSEHALTKEQFNAAFPAEFWREVVDRAAKEAPDTLLLAEAFWLMEGYFVRTLGMHRVYNSAFMNMLRNEENAKYRTLIKSTIEFDPEILKRYVNFMNNPDERTAVDQFGKGDKYFGICILMVTLPGLPMFGHGQVEGYSEKYGMEFRRALWDEQPDGYLIDRHAREVFPLLHKRALFAGVDNFLLFDFFSDNGAVDENVFAYSNQIGDERGLVVYNNRFASTSGWIRTSASFVSRASGTERVLVQRTLAEGLGLHNDVDLYLVARDQATGLEHIFPSQELVNNGLYLRLNGYQYNVFIEIREVRDDEWKSYRHLCAYLNGRGVPSIQEALRELTLQPVLGPFREIANPGYIQHLLDQRLQAAGESLAKVVLTEAGTKLSHLLDGIQHITGLDKEKKLILERLNSGLSAALSLSYLADLYPMPGSKAYAAALDFLTEGMPARNLSRWTALIGWLFIRDLGRLGGGKDSAALTRSWIDEYQLGKALDEAARGLGLDAPAVARTSTLVRLLTELQGWYADLGGQPLRSFFETLLANEEVRLYLNINRYKDVLWFNQEAFDELVWWLYLAALMDALGDPQNGAALFMERALICHDITLRLQKAVKTSEYQVAKLLLAL